MEFLLALYIKFWLFFIFIFLYLHIVFQYTEKKFGSETIFTQKLLVNSLQIGR